MKKIGQRGFMLTETLVVAVIVTTTLVFLYTQFRTVNTSYKTSFQYNNVEELYALGNVSDYLKTNGLNVLGPAVSSTDEQYLDITSCPAVFLSESTYCQSLLSSLNIKKLIIGMENLDSLKNNLNHLDFSTNMKTFIGRIAYKNESVDYRLIAEFKNGTFATIKLK